MFKTTKLKKKDDNQDFVFLRKLKAFYIIISVGNLLLTFLKQQS